MLPDDRLAVGLLVITLVFIIIFGVIARDNMPTYISTEEIEEVKGLIHDISQEVKTLRAENLKIKRKTGY